MRFLVVGVGAIGGAYLAFLSKAGHEAFGLVKKGRKLDRIRVSGIWGEFETPVRTIDDVNGLPWKPDLIIISVKSYDTEKALEQVKPVVGENIFLMNAQNGYGNYEKSAELFGEDRVILARVIFGSRVVSAGEIEITVCADDVVIGNPAGLIDENFLKNLAEVFTKSGIPTRYDREVYKYLWDKIIYNCALNPLGALLEANYGMLAQNPHTREIMDRIIDEVFEVAEKAGIESFWKSSEEYKKVFYERLIPPTSAHYPSMLADIKKGKTEIDALNGAIWKLGRKHGIDTPTNELITKLVKAKEEFNRTGLK